MNILGFNPSHHGSVCLLQDGEIKYFIQEERIGNRIKYDSIPFKSFINLLQNYKIDVITWASPSIKYPITNKDDTPYWYKLAFSYHPKVKLYDASKDAHHLSHIAHSFYNSGFKECLGIVIDGFGSLLKDKNIIGQETETIFYCSYPSNFKILYKNAYGIFPSNIKNNFKNLYITNNVTLSRVYETITMHLGWSRNEAGKTMGLAPYGKNNKNIPTLIKFNTGDPSIFYYDLTQESLLPNQNETFIDEENNPQLKLQRDPREWHYDESKITDLEKDLAWQIQNDTQQLVGDYVEKAIKKTGLKQVCCAGGYFLNCVTNYYLTKRFPDIEFYFEPIANDSGTAIGAAKLVWHSQTQDTTKRPFKSLYLGPQYSKEQLLEGIKKYVSN